MKNGQFNWKIRVIQSTSFNFFTKFSTKFYTKFSLVNMNNLNFEQLITIFTLLAGGKIINMEYPLFMDRMKIIIIKLI